MNLVKHILICLLPIYGLVLLIQSNASVAGENGLVGASCGLETLTKKPQDNFITLNGLTYFCATHPTLGNELHVTNGREFGTRLVVDLASGEASSNPASFFTKKGQLYFFAETNEDGLSLWRYAPKSNAVTLIKANLGAATFRVFELKQDRFLVEVFDENSVFGKFVQTDGTRAGTNIIQGMNGRCGVVRRFGSSLSNWHETSYQHYGDDLFFVTWSQICKVSNGAVSYVAAVPYMNYGAETFLAKLSYQGGMVINANGEIWLSDGTSSGTAILKSCDRADSNSPCGQTQVAVASIDGNLIIVESTYLAGAYSGRVYAVNGDTETTLYTLALGCSDDPIKRASTTQQFAFFNMCGNSLVTDGTLANTHLYATGAVGISGREFPVVYDANLYIAFAERGLARVNGGDLSLDFIEKASTSKTLAPMDAGVVFYEDGRTTGMPDTLKFFDSSGVITSLFSFYLMSIEGLPHLAGSRLFIPFTSGLADQRVISTGGPFGKTHYLRYGNDFAADIGGKLNPAIYLLLDN